MTHKGESEPLADEYKMGGSLVCAFAGLYQDLTGEVRCAAVGATAGVGSKRRFSPPQLLREYSYSVYTAASTLSLSTLNCHVRDVSFF